MAVGAVYTNSFSQMNHSINMILEPFLKAEYLVKQKWNDETVVIETVSYYIFYVWGTAA
ncbi:MAG: hypothetical protein IKK91_00590 [Ruminococcus sp.]|nr:hypothetical protein [Ruminococcus sp.]